MKLNVLKQDGSDSGVQVDLQDAIFAVTPNHQVMYEDVRSYLSNQRQGTAKTKTRNEVRGGGKKAFKQKGTGGARRGSLRSPLLEGGGTIYGPEPRDYTVRLTKKMRQLARKSALTYKAQENAIIVVEDFTFDAPKTKSFTAVLKNLKVDGRKVLFLTAGTDSHVYLSGRNVPNVSILEANKPSTYEIMDAEVLVIQLSGVATLESTFSLKQEVAA